MSSRMWREEMQLACRGCPTCLAVSYQLSASLAVRILREDLPIRRAAIDTVPLAPVLRGEGLGVRGSSVALTDPLTPDLGCSEEGLDTL